MNGPLSREHSNVASVRSDANVKAASVSTVGEDGPDTLVSGVESSKTSTSSGGKSPTLSRPFSVCSSPTPSSTASRTWKPWLADVYMSSTCAVTSHASGPSTEGVDAACPVVPGWLAQVTVFSPHAEATRSASSVRSSLAEEASSFRVAAAMLVQPPGSAGSGKRTSARALLPICDFTFSDESVPKLFVGLPCAIQLSLSAAKLCGVVAQVSAGGPPSGSSKTRMSSGGWSMPFSRAWNDCLPVSSSLASRMTKPWAPFAYMSSVCARTFHSRSPRPDPDVAVGPAALGWLLQLTPSSVHGAVSRRASRFRPSVAADE